MRKKGGKISDFIAESVYSSELKGFDLAATQLGWFTKVATPVLMVYPTIKPTRFYSRNCDYYLDAAGNAIGGIGALRVEIMIRPRSNAKSWLADDIMRPVGAYRLL